MSAHDVKTAAAAPEIFGVMAEFATPRDLLHAAEKVRAEGYVKLDAYSPFPVHGLDRVLGVPGSKVPWIVLAGAIAGGIGGLLLQWWTSAVDYPIKIAGKPFFSIPAFVPVTFELTILLSAFAAVFGMLFEVSLPVTGEGVGGLHPQTLPSFILAQGDYIPIALVSYFVIRKAGASYSEVFFLFLL